MHGRKKHQIACIYVTVKARRLVNPRFYRYIPSMCRSEVVKVRKRLVNASISGFYQKISVNAGICGHLFVKSPKWAMSLFEPVVCRSEHARDSYLFAHESSYRCWPWWKNPHDQGTESQVQECYCRVYCHVFETMWTMTGKTKSLKKGIVVKPILHNEMIDMQSNPDRDMTFILMYQDHLTKFVILRSLHNKRAEDVAYHLLDIFTTFGAPNILHSDNGRENFATKS